MAPFLRGHFLCFSFLCGFWFLNQKTARFGTNIHAALGAKLHAFFQFGFTCRAFGLQILALFLRQTFAASKALITHVIIPLNQKSAVQRRNFKRLPN